ncbi:MAG: formyltetrahydrofolate deformylase [Candidatus Omnitrophica bacterium]|nr:formyltetrahydrofolate deformylase [Candidatus Omnitrophota bacterium]
MHTYIILFQCKDKPGIVAKLSDFILKNQGNIIIADQYSTSLKNGHFFMRVEFDVDGKAQGMTTLGKGLSLIAKVFNAKASLYEKDKPLRMGICVSQPQHCLAEILYLWRTGELNVDIPFVISNFKNHKQFIEEQGVPFYFIPATKKDRREKELLKLAIDKTDFLVLSRYMLILSNKFLKAYNKDIINIHHGFLPSFKGGNPYAQALKKGVKVIGATSHFVNESLDEGPIITQSVESVSHKDELADLIRKGKTLEKRSLVDAIRAYIDYRIIRHNNTTIVF